MIEDTILALSTAPGMSAIALIRLSGPKAIEIAAKACMSTKISDQKSHTVKLVRIVREDKILDELVLTVYRAPKSFTREDVAEFACHGSPYIIREIMDYLLFLGARLANPGEFTQRAFLNGAMDLAQAEAVADLIASESELAHSLAMDQMRGGFSDTLRELRERMLNFASLIELELDFAEEDVEFADRTQLRLAVQELKVKIKSLADSFAVGNVIRTGIPTAIIGKPNAGKSTLLNVLLNDSRAIVSEIPGTTRDVVEDRLFLKGAEFRLMDTAGIRDTSDSIEQQGIQRSMAAAQKAKVILYVFDCTLETVEEARSWCAQNLSFTSALSPQVLLIANKTDLNKSAISWPEDILPLSALKRDGLETLEEAMIQAAGISRTPDIIVTNARHHQALLKTLHYLNAVEQGMDQNLTSDLIAEDLRAAMYELGTITGDISNDEVLGNIFGKFCIGK